MIPSNHFQNIIKDFINYTQNNPTIYYFIVTFAPQFLQNRESKLNISEVRYLSGSVFCNDLHYWLNSTVPQTTVLSFF